ncbi:MAG TPA: replication-relaxation family protein [Solirubrobacteraceae bacterium]|jgi:hypothetical protein|nr:replication-relaxation family protein [Solirubrobacteraceae bacterium]
MAARYLTTAALRTLEAKLTERDLAVLQHVSRLRLLTGSQLTRLCFADDDDLDANARAARRALLRLTRLGVLERLPRSVGGVRSGSAGFVYRLDLGGQRLAISRGWQPEWRRRRSLVPGSLFLLHTLQVAELHTRLVESERSRRFELLELTAEPSCWRSYDGFGSQREVLKPDSFVRLGIGPYEDSYFIEVDRGTEGTQTLVRQLAIYVAYHRSGAEQREHGVFPRVLWLTTTDTRTAVITECVRRLPRADRELFRVARFEDAIEAMQASTDKE